MQRIVRYFLHLLLLIQIDFSYYSSYKSIYLQQILEISFPNLKFKMVYSELLLLHFKYLLIYFFMNIILILFNLFYLLKQRNKYMHTYISIFEESCKGNYKLLISESNTLENIFWIISSNIVFQYFYTQNNNKNIDIYI